MLAAFDKKYVYPNSKKLKVEEVLITHTPMSATMGIARKELPQLQIRIVAQGA